MFVRWIPRNREIYRSWHGDDVTHWRALLVENRRVNGKVRQRHLAYLAGFHEGSLRVPAQRLHLWDKITQRFDGLGAHISPAQRVAIEETMRKRIGPPPTAEERIEINRNTRALLGDKWCDEQYGVDFGR